MNDKVIETKGLTKRFGSFTAVDHISFEVGRGEIFGFLGANGAGKTTAMRMLCGLSRPTEGGGTVAGFDIVRQSEQIKRNIGYMSQRFSLYEDLKVWENIRLFGGIYGMGSRQIAEKTDRVLRRLGFAEERNTLVSALPLGWKQKLAFSVAIFHEPRIVFLDEPTGGVDPATRRQFWELIYDASERRDYGLRDDALHGRGGVLQPRLDHGRRGDPGAGYSGQPETNFRRAEYGRGVPPPRPRS